MVKENKVIGGDFPEGSILSLVRTRQGYDVEIRDPGPGILRSVTLKGKVSEIKIIREVSTDGALTPLESGIIGGAVASIPGFLGGYLTAKDPDSVVFFCRLKDGREFWGLCSRLFYENMNDVLFKRKNMQTGCCLVSVFGMPFLAVSFLLKK